VEDITLTLEYEFGTTTMMMMMFTLLRARYHRHDVAGICLLPRSRSRSRSAYDEYVRQHHHRGVRRTTRYRMTRSEGARARMLMFHKFTL
jgi:hypothetical protein